MTKFLLIHKNILIRSIIIIFAILFIGISKDLKAAPGDTTWVTTFNQNFQNWADVHYNNFVLPDTTVHYKQIIMYYTIGCPAAGCDPWDRLGWVKLYPDTNTSFEIARVITPYNIVGAGYPGQCVFKIDVTDYMPLLHNTVRLGSYIESWIGGARGWLVTIKFAYIEGEMTFKPFKVINLWQDNHVLYGDPVNSPETYLTPKNILIDQVTTKAKVRLTNTGHGQGNTDNAAEFSYKIHNLIVGPTTWEHYLWRSDCSTNPCSPQGGTWQYPRAGWCPGASVTPWETDVTASATPGQNIVFDYNLMEYENFCRPNNSLCVSGVTCSDCNYNYNGHTEPHYTIQSQLILYKPNPFSQVQVLNSQIPESFNLFQNYPNPFNPFTKIKFDLAKSSYVKLSVYDIQGKLVKTIVEGELTAGSYNSEWDASGVASGIYVYKIEAGDFISTKRMMLVK